MSHLSLKTAFEKARIEAPDISKEQFLEQTRAHLESGRIRASAFDCITNGDRLVPRDVARREIPTIEWAELKLYFDGKNQGFAAIWGHDRSPEWTRDDGTGAEVWGDGWFDGAPVYSDLLLIADRFDGLWRCPEQVWTERELRDFVDDELEKAGGARITRRRQKELLKNVRRYVPSRLDKKIFEMFDEAQGTGKAGRPRKDENVQEK